MEEYLKEIHFFTKTYLSFDEYVLLTEYYIFHIGDLMYTMGYEWEMKYINESQYDLFVNKN